MKTALILFAHGARDPAWADPMRRVQAAIRARFENVAVELAFLEFMTPTLSECVATLVGQGARRIIVLPMFIAQGGHLKKDVPELLQVLRSTHENVEFSLASAVGEQEIVVQAMAEAAIGLLGSELA